MDWYSGWAAILYVVTDVCHDPFGGSFSVARAPSCRLQSHCLRAAGPTQRELRAHHTSDRFPFHDSGVTKRFSLAPMITSHSMVATSPSAIG